MFLVTDVESKEKLAVKKVRKLISIDQLFWDV